MADYLFPRSDEASANKIHDITIEQINALLQDNEVEKQEGIRMTQSSYRGENYTDDPRLGRFGFYKDVVERDTRTAGMRVYYPHGIVISQPARRNFYRGENAIFPSSVPSLVRKLRNYTTREEKELYRLVADMRVYEFKCLLERFEQTKYWADHYGDVLYELLAQHYGLETCWLDITTDFEIALFFANCYYENGRWHPLTKEQTEGSEDKKYGMIFHMPSYQHQFRIMEELRDRYQTFVSNSAKTGSSYILEKLDHPTYTGEPGNVILPVGFQPFERSAAQHAYAIYMRDERPLQKDRGFEKLRFRHDEKLAKWIYERMDGGKKIYPYEGLSDCQFIINQISSLTQFSEEAYYYGVYRSHYFKLDDIEKVRAKVQSFEVNGSKIKIIDRHPWKLSALRRKKVDSLYTDFSLENWYGVHVMTREASAWSNPFFEPWMLMTEEDEPGVIDFKLRDKVNCGYRFDTQMGMSLLELFS